MEVILSARTEKLRQKFLAYSPNVCIERARIYTDFFHRRREAEGEPLIVRKALAFARLIRERSIYIEDGQLVAGSLASRPRGFPLFPESMGDDFIGELGKIRTRPLDRFEFSIEDERELLEDLLPLWRGHSLREYVYRGMKPEEKLLFLMDPETDLVRGTNIFTLDVPLYGPGGHITPDFQTVLGEGFQGIKARAMERLRRAEQEGDSGAVDFLRAAAICCDAITGLGRRYSDLALDLAGREADPERRQELLAMAGACRQVPGLPARTFHEAVQSAWFAYAGMLHEGYQRCYGAGRMDQYLYPYYRKDLREGRITPAGAQELIDCLWIKFAETNYINSEYYSHVASGFPSQQQICVGGQTPDGRDATNELTYMCIQATMNTRLHQPSLSVRFWEGTPDSLVEKACQLARLGTGHPSFFNDRRVVPALVKKGVAPEDARDYSSVGCAGVQPTRKDKGSHNSGYLSFAAALELALTNGWWRSGRRRVGVETGDPRSFESFDRLLEAFTGQLAHLIDVYHRASVRVEQVHREVLPTPYLSCFVQDCVERGRDRTDGGAFYNFGLSPRAVGFADVADSLAAIKKLVFEEGGVGMGELLDALEANFEGREDLRQMLRTRAPKYGNDDPYADEIAQRVVDIYVTESNRHRSLFGGYFHPGFSSVSANVPYGRAIGALPNGRLAWTPLADGISPSHWADREGPTAVALSCGRLDHEGMSGGSILNVKFTADALSGEEGIRRMAAYVRGLMEAGVWHAQFNVVDAGILREAQAHPEEYPDLLVRVAGYSAFFTSLSRQLQDDVIDRTEHRL